MIITRTPFRVSLFGGGTDFPIWYRENGGAVLSFSINKYCYITVRELPPFFEHRYRIAYSRVETVSQLSDIKHPAVRESVRKYLNNVGLEIHHDGDLPARSGVGSSSAFAVGMIHALRGLRGDRDISKLDLARQAITLEQDVLKENVGSQDQIACSVGGINLIEFFTKDSGWVVSNLDLSMNRSEDLESRIALYYTGILRTSSNISLGLLSNIRSRQSLLYRTKELAYESLKIIKSDRDLDEIGPLLDDSWNIKKELNPFSVNEKLLQLYAYARQCGALGGKVLGAGGGGFLLFWLKPGQFEHFRTKFSKGTLVPIRLEKKGSEIIYLEESQESNS